MSQRQYWLDLFTGVTWDEFQKAGSSTSGFRESRWSTVKQIQPGDFLLCYLTGISRFVGLLEVTSEPFKDNTIIWESDPFPCRLKVKPIVVLKPETAVPVFSMKDRLSFFQNMKSPNAWTGRFRGSPTRWTGKDGEAVVEALFEAQRNPTHREFDPKKLASHPRTFRSGKDDFTVPADDEIQKEEPGEILDTVNKHTQIQWLLLKLGSEMGFDLWVARNDKNKEINGFRFSDIPKIKDKLPLQFDDATNKTIELIDVLWLRRNGIEAAFEIESTTSIYSGLLRMSDLLSMHPNLNIPLYLVAPEQRREKVFTEINRPTFSKLIPPLYEVCRFISFEKLEEFFAKLEKTELLHYLKPDVLETLSETCEVE